MTVIPKETTQEGTSRMPKCCAIAMLILALFRVDNASGGITIPGGFEVDTLAAPNSGDVPRLEAIRSAGYGEGVIAAFVDGNALRFLRINESGVQALTPTPADVDSFMLDLRFDTSGEFSNRLYATLATPENAGGHPVQTEFLLVSSSGQVQSIRTFGDESNPMNLVVDFTRDQNDFAAGAYLEDQDEAGGTALIHLAGDLTATLLGANVLPGGRTDMDVSGMEFDPTGQYDGHLVMADADDDDDVCVPVRMRSDLAMGNVGVPASLNNRHFSDMAFSPGGAIPAGLYVADRVTETVFGVSPQGDYAPFARGFRFIESITISSDGDVMYVSDSAGVHRIRAEKPVENAIRCMTLSSGAASFVEGNTMSLINVGQPAIGTAYTASMIIRTGVMPCLARQVVPVVVGDCNNDRTVNLLDYGCFFDCVTGSGGGVLEGCDTYDFDFDSDIDAIDWRFLQVIFLNP